MNDAIRIMGGMIQMKKHCQVCGVVFTGHQASKYCEECKYTLDDTCKKCGKPFKRKVSYERCHHKKFKHGICPDCKKPKPRKCKWCGKGHFRKSQQFCSDECQGYHVALQHRKRGNTLPTDDPKVYLAQCKVCKDRFPKHIDEPFKNLCDVCKATQKERLADAHRRQRAKRIIRIQEQDSIRQQHKSINCESVDWLTVMKRDNWTCHVCGCKVNPSHKLPVPDAPVLDHVIPLSKGGTHTYDNIKCCHALCNSRKWNNLLYPNDVLWEQSELKPVVRWKEE